MARKSERAQLARTLVATVLICVALVLMAVGLKGTPEEPPSPAPRQRMMGIDVSSHQGQIDWQAVAESGVEFAMIRLGYRGYDSGTLHVDANAHQNLEGARAAGLKIGAYFFSQALTAQEAQEEAALALEVLDGMVLDLPLAYDWEYVADTARTGAMDGDTLLSCVEAFCASVEDYEPMVYFNQELSRTLLDLEKIAYPFWLAKYGDSLDVAYQVRMWQYTDSGTVPGIEGNVDMNYYYPI